jgi:hypothetical protein
MKKIITTLALSFVCVASVCAQKILVLSGEIASLKGQTEFNVVYDYSALEVGDYPSEKAYKDKKIAEYNKKEAGRGDKWSESWERDKAVRYPEKFEALINKGLSAKGMHFSQNNDAAKYTLIVKTKFIEPGFNVGVASKPSAVSFEYIFVEKDNPSTVVLTMSQKFVPGAQAMGFDYDTGTRISESYAKAGKMLAASINKALK